MMITKLESRLRCKSDIVVEISNLYVHSPRFKHRADFSHDDFKLPGSLNK
jgi:hypothetical protein